MNRLTDRRTAEQVRENIEKLQAKGFEVSISDLRHVKLAEYEDKEKRGEWVDERYEDLLQCYCAFCSACGYESIDHYRITDTHSFCENCGARMIKEGDTE